MNMLKKSLALLMTLCILLSVVACTPAAEPAAPAATAAPAPAAEATAAPEQPAEPAAEGKVFNIYCWNTEFQDRFNAYYASKVPADVKVNFVINPSQDNVYQNALDEALLRQADAAPDEKIDIFLVEADYALKYCNTDYTLDILKDVGLTQDDISQQYKYTQDIVTDSNGAIKGSSWQATPGLFIYRRSIAKDVLGTDDPAQVQEALSSWDKFDAVAQQAKDKGYFMLSGYDDAYRTFSNNISAPWVDANNKINLDANMIRWIDQTKLYTDNGYNNKTTLWNPEWQADQGPAGKVFGFFYSTWGVNFTLLGNSLAKPVSEGGVAEVGNGIYGDYAMCEGPQSYYWGGTWICAATGTDNMSLVRDIMKTLTCDAATMKQITIDTQDYTNNQAAMSELASSDIKFDFLGGQNHIAMFAKVAPKISMTNMSPYDQTMAEQLQRASKDYFDGKVTKEQAIENFYTAVIEKHPELSK